MMRKTRQVSVCLKSSARGVSSNCSSCVTCRPWATSSSLSVVSSIKKSGVWSPESGVRSQDNATFICLDFRLQTPDSRLSKGHDVEAAVHVEDFAGDAGGERA